VLPIRLWLVFFVTAAIVFVILRTAKWTMKVVDHPGLAREVATGARRFLSVGGTTVVIFITAACSSAGSDPNVQPPAPPASSAPTPASLQASASAHAPGNVAQQVVSLAASCVSTMNAADAGNPLTCESDGGDGITADMVAIGQHALPLCDDLKPSGTPQPLGSPQYAKVSDSDALNGSGSTPELECSWSLGGQSFFYFNVEDSAHSPSDGVQPLVSSSPGVTSYSDGSLGDYSTGSDATDVWFERDFTDSWTVDIESDVGQPAPTQWTSPDPDLAASIDAALLSGRATS
jgi:hypothetical protein